MKINSFVFLFFATLVMWSQEQVDLIMPKNGAFNAGANLEGLIQNSVNEATGKAVVSVPLASVVSRAVSHNVGLLYSGQSAFEIAKNTNKYNPTSVAGVGFSLMIPKIVVDNKNTATREDDEFYLQDGVNNTKLVCVAKIDQQISSNEWIKNWDFVTEKYTTLKIKFNSREYNGIFTTDNFVVTTDQGMKYTYGGSYDDGLNANEKVVAWGNWIGDSNLGSGSGGVGESIIWNLSKIEDQWGNNITFQYNLVQQPMGGTYQTEAAYLSKMTASTGEYVLFEYADKLSEEYYEPHKEQQEPDAFQERYEKKYLAFVKSYNSKNALASSVELQYKIVNHPSGDKKRFLEKIIQKGKQGNAMPPQVFEYYENGDFQGGIKKITYPMGGSVTYTYNKKFLFSNGYNRFDQSYSYNGYKLYSTVVKDNYVLQLLINENDYVEEGPITSRYKKYRFKILRFVWNGKAWEANEHVIPHYIKNDSPNFLENFEAFFEEDYYGYMYKHSGEPTLADLHIFHLNKEDSRTWEHFNVEHGIGNYDCAVLSGDDFVAFGEYNSSNSNLITYVRNNNTWEIKVVINQPMVNNRYGADENYIMVLTSNNELTFNEFINGQKNDIYSFLYLDATRNWQKVSWTNSLQNLNDIYHSDGQNSVMYPSNSFIGFMADNNGEYILGWDKNYNLTNIHGISNYPDSQPFVPTYNNMFTLMDSWYSTPIKSLAYNGNSWNEHNFSLSDQYYKPVFGKNINAFHINPNGLTYAGILNFNPNSSTWNYNPTFSQIYPSGFPIVGFTNGLMVAGSKIYKYTNTDYLPVFDQNIYYENDFTQTNGYNFAFVKLKTGSVFEKGILLGLDKQTNLVTAIDFGKKYQMKGHYRFGGHYPFLSTNTVWLRDEGSGSSYNSFLYRIIDNQVNNFVYDVVVDKIEINDGIQTNNRTIKYTYEDFSCTPNNDVVYYGKVTTEDKGYGNSSLGTVIKKYNNGSTDLSMVGLLLEEEVKDVSNNRLTYKINQYEKITRSAPSASGIIKRSNVNLINSQEKVYKNPGSSDFILTETSYTYTPSTDPRNLLLTTKKVAKDVEEITEISYAYKQSLYSDFESRNLVSHPYEVKTKINNKESSVKRYVWTKTSDLNKVYNSDILQGVSSTSLRNGSTTNSKIDDFGHAIEVSDNRGASYKEQFTAMLYGYGYKFPIASVNNVKYDDVLATLDVTIQNLQTLSNSVLKTELMKLYQRLSDAAISLTIYDDDGRVVEKIDNRERSTKYYYDEFGRLDYVVDNEGKVIKKQVYHLINN